MSTQKNFRNTLLKRKEIEMLVDSISNPGFQKATELVAAETKAAPETIALKAVRGNFGTHQFLIEAFVYDSVQDKDLIEPKKKVKKAPEVGN